jgi:hypothetical protein
VHGQALLAPSSNPDWDKRRQGSMINHQMLTVGAGGDQPQFPRRIKTDVTSDFVGNLGMEHEGTGEEGACGGQRGDEVRGK